MGAGRGTAAWARRGSSEDAVAAPPPRIGSEDVRSPARARPVVLGHRRRFLDEPFKRLGDAVAEVEARLEARGVTLHRELREADAGEEKRPPPYLGPDLGMEAAKRAAAAVVRRTCAAGRARGPFSGR